ncbi:coniferyl-alcohol dehydrogenase [Nocardia miyunensis]|uniref:coniferyl-alcohol dehydrogenase n=1 Tax=Nocardia miyunensis TaxID=282684 RepID=UPI00082B14AC|nr:coniferyl-alcohol dehydrogenase [Nocardia miyunensis]
MKDPLGYSGLHVVVTGAASGMGAATARILVQLGARVTGVDVKPTQAPVDLVIEADLRDPDSIAEAAATINGPVHAVFSCAGLPGGAFPPVDVLLVNFVGARHFVELLLPKIAPGGAIAAIASNAAMGWQLQLSDLMELVTIDGFGAGKKWCEENTQRMEPDAYSFSKKVLNAWVASRAATLITEGIRLNCINPGPTDTAMMPHFVEHSGAQIVDAFVGPIGRHSTAEEQAWPLVFLNSPRSSYVNGETFTTDGGFFGAVQTGQLDLASLFGEAGQQT